MGKFDLLSIVAHKPTFRKNRSHGTPAVCVDLIILLMVQKQSCQAVDHTFRIHSSHHKTGPDFHFKKTSSTPYVFFAITTRKKMTRKNITYIYIYFNIYIYIGYCPLPLTVTTRSIIFVIGDSYKPSFATVTGRGHHPIYIYIYI